MFTHVLDTWLVFLSVLLVVLTVRIAWSSQHGGLLQPADWNVAEQTTGRVAAVALALVALISGLTAAYVSARVPWVANFEALLANPPKPVAGRQPQPISTAAYLFSMPVGLGVCAAMLTDPGALALVRFRGPRHLVLRVLPLIGAVVGGMSIWRSVGALSAAQW